MGFTNVVDKPKFLFYCDYLCATGYGRTAEKLIDALSHKFNGVHIDVAAINYHGNIEFVKPNVQVIPVKEIAIERRNSVQISYGLDGMYSLLLKSNYELFFCFQDIGIIQPTIPILKNILQEKRKAKQTIPKTIFYFPVDSEPKKQHIENMEVFDQLICQTRYGKQELLKLNPNLNVEVVYHGMDTSGFLPLPEEERKKYREELYGSDDILVFGTVNGNNVRKDMPTTLQAYKRYKAEVNSSDFDSILHMHCSPVDKIYGYDLLDICRQLDLKVGIDGDVYFSDNYDRNKGFSQKRLNQIYNGFDFFITNTMAEGWGYTIPEAMACKVPVIAAMHTSIPEVSGGHIIELETLRECFIPNDNNYLRKRTCFEETANKMKLAHDLHYETGRTQKVFDMIEAAFSHVGSFKWDDCCNGIIKVFENVIER